MRVFIQAVWVASFVAAAPLQAVANEFIFGVGTHFAFTVKRGYLPETQRPLLSGLGVDSFRDDVHEGAFTVAEPTQPLGRQIDRLNALLLDRRQRPVLILIGRQLSDKPVPRSAPTSPRETELFALFGGRVVAATQAYNPIYETWNEWNMKWRPRQAVAGPIALRTENADYSPENYVAVAQATYNAVKGVSPSGFVLTGAIGDDDGWEWTRRALKAGLAKTGDGISAHFYNHCNPPPQRTAENLISKVESFYKVVREESGAKPLPLYITEFGWPTDQGPCGIPPDLAAANLAQFTLWAPTNDWIKGIWVYELRNSGQDRIEREDNFGLYDYDNRPKPSACMYGEAIKLSRSLKGAHFRQAPSGVRWLEGQGSDGKPVWVIWTTARDARMSVRYSDGSPVVGRALCSSGEANASVNEAGMVPLIVPAVRSADQLVIRPAS